jgi:hypothetical protein
MTITGTRQSTRSRTGGRWVGTAAVVACLVLASGCTSTGSGGGSFLTTGELRLVSFDSCEAASEGLRAAALDHVGPWGVGTAGAMVDRDSMAGDGAAERAGTVAEAAPAPAGDLAGTEFAAPGGPTHSGTNVHETGVDEPDLVKTDGRRIVTVADGTLRVVDALRRMETGTLSLQGQADQPYGWQVSDLLLHGDRALVLVRGAWWGPMPLPRPMPGPVPDRDTPGAADQPTQDDVLPEPIAGPRLLLVDLTGQPRVVSEYTVDGELIDARSVGPTARVVVRSGPRLQLPMLEPDASERERLAANRAAVADADVSDWLPRYQLTAGGRTTTGQVECTALTHPESFSGTSMLTVLTFDLGAAALGDGLPVSVVADGDTVYSNGANLYVASDQRWRGAVESDRDGRSEIEQRTEIYKFDVSEPGRPRYVAAGQVPGWLINQYAMSEWDGHLRVATTTGELWWGEEPDSESAVYVLSEQGGALVEVGSVGGLGRTERIYAVRFAGPVGYVVTFRETDPLYTVDLSDPAAPTVLGELKITGYSAYLHPIGDDRVLGIGQEADPRGVTQGTQISLFDVSDLSEPELLAQHHIRYGHSEAEFDPHAFLWWPAERLVVVPLTAMPTGRDRGDVWAPEHGALVLRVGDRSFTELEIISHPAAGQWERTGQIRRSLVIDDTLWTVSTSGLQADDLASLDTVAWLPFR